MTATPRPGRREPTNLARARSSTRRYKDLQRSFFASFSIALLLGTGCLPSDVQDGGVPPTEAPDAGDPDGGVSFQCPSSLVASHGELTTIIQGCTYNHLDSRFICPILQRFGPDLEYCGTYLFDALEYAERNGTGCRTEDSTVIQCIRNAAMNCTPAMAIEYDESIDCAAYRYFVVDADCTLSIAGVADCSQDLFLADSCEADLGTGCSPPWTFDPTACDTSDTTDTSDCN
jgi:hypothetical protein